MKQSFCLVPGRPDIRLRAKSAIDEAPDGFVVEIKPATRSLEANARLWAMLADISEQTIWYGRKLPPEDWKHIFTASLKKMDVVPNLEGSGFVALGLSTSKMSKKEMSDLQELISAFAAEHNVKLREPE